MNCKNHKTDLGKTTKSRCILPTPLMPASAMAMSNSVLSKPSTLSTPLCPSQASPQMTGRPTKTILAPRASAFSTSVPRVTPPSRYI